MTHKTCSRCKRELPTSYFNVRRDRLTPQYHSQCKPCKAGRHRARQNARKAAEPRIWPAVHRKENNAFNLWHGPVSRHQPLRWAA